VPFLIVAAVATLLLVGAGWHFRDWSYACGCLAMTRPGTSR